MGTMVCRGLQSCLDQSQIVADPTVIRIKFSSSSPKPHFEFILKPCFPDTRSNNTDDDFGCCNWSFLQSHKEFLDTEKKEAINITYIHPLVKPSTSSSSLTTSSLRDKSLNICTENLGNETGSDIMENGAIFSSLFSLNSGIRRQVVKPRRALSRSYKKVDSTKSFPPPLTTMNGSDLIRVQPHREDGRLILEAVKTPVRSSYLLAERGQGRLRICFMKETIEESEEGNDEKEEEFVDYYEHEDENEDGEEREEDGNNKSLGAEMKIENFERTKYGCGEGKNYGHDQEIGRLNWEASLAATN